MTRWLQFAVPLWSGVLALLVCAPLLAPGFVLSYDMVWVPHLDLSRADLWGLGSALPRAVPSDLFVALLGAVLPAAIVQKVVLLGALFAAGMSMGSLLCSLHLAARLAAVTLYVWNPFVAERLVLGQWPLLIAYAAVPWLIAALGSERGVRRPAVVIALAATALTPATGLMGVLLAFLVKGRGGSFRLGLVAVAVNAHWIVAGILHAPIARSDGAAIALFDVQPEGNFGRLGAALSLGGIWNAEVVPSSRGMMIGLILAGLMWAVMIIGATALWREERRLLVGLAVAGAIGLALALSGWLAADAMAALVRTVPAAGLLRDGTRYLLLLAPLEAITFGYGAKRLAETVRKVQARQFLAVIAVVMPLAALPDLAWGVGGKLQPTDYPVSWYAARTAISSSDVTGDVIVLPFSSYRRPDWNHDHSVLDPAGRFFDRETVTSDRLFVSGKAIAGEDPRAARIARILATASPAKSLAREGIGIVVVETDAGTVASGKFAGMDKIYRGKEMRVLTIDQAAARVNVDRDLYLMIGAWLLAFLALGFAVTFAVLNRLKRQLAEHRSRHVT